MSGHSKFANIKRKKEKNDAAKGKIITKIVRELSVAVKHYGGSNPDENYKLRDIISKAKANNISNDTIKNAIQKAVVSNDDINYKEIVYEGYGPCGVAIIVEALTNNKNRTSSNIKNIFAKCNGNIGIPGCVSFIFKKQGQIYVYKEDCNIDSDELMLIALDCGAYDFYEKNDKYIIFTNADNFFDVRFKIENKGILIRHSCTTMIPKNHVSVSDMKSIDNIKKLIDLLYENDDVQKVYTNLEE